MAVEMVDEIDEGPEQPRLKLVAPDAKRARQHVPEPARERQPPAKPDEAVLEVLSAIARALALRALLWLGFIVESALGVGVMWNPEWPRVAAFALVSLMAYAPVVYLNTRKP